MAEKPALLIFDVDGTLTDSASLTRSAFEKAIEDIYSIPNSSEGIAPYGKTDQGIFREILVNNGITTTDFRTQFDNMSRLSAIYLEKGLKASKLPKLHKGIRSLLERLATEDDIFLALGTGNTKINSYIKLDLHGIGGYFPVGGFGCDDEDRIKIVETAYNRAINYYKVDFKKQFTWIIGDTPLDIECGKAIKVKTIAVATGNYSVDELKQYNPDMVFSTLSDEERFLSLVRQTA
ncbi:HAD hydrolase-like protein [bacterium]|nr:HAD hydrolase-like protein [bacterium]